MIELKEITTIEDFAKYFDEYVNNPHRWTEEEIAEIKILCRKFNVSERVLYMHGDDFRRKGDVSNAQK